MKNLDKRWLLFLVLILILATGLPYLSLNQEASTTSEEQVDDVQSMSIALVNEDEGARFNGSELTFGEAFVRSLDSNDDHNWFVVSRGVAESGLNQNTYDMMIVIPNDFSEKALSIDSESPEQVVLNYQINASDDEYIRAEAERTASTILNEFNRRIIDVYFASIIGNLQDAQDNIGEIVEKQVEHTTTYNHDINNPLSNYTNQFGTIKDNTQVSRDSFGGLEDMMEGFEERLAEGADQKQGYSSELDEFTSIKEANNSELLSFSDALLQFDNLLNNQDAEQNLVDLQEANEFINYQLQRFDEEEYDENIVTEISTLRSYINSAINRVDLANDILVDRLEELEEEIVPGILSEILDVSGEQKGILLSLFNAQDQNLRGTINDQISKLPSLDENDFIGHGLPEKTKHEIRNVIAVANGYNNDPEFDHAASRIDNDEILSHFIQRLKNHLSTNGVTIKDTVWIPENEKKGQEFTLDISDEYELTKLNLKFPGEKMEDYTDKYKEKNKLILEPNQKGKFKIKVSLRLKDEDSDISVFDPVKLGWKLKHKYVEKEEIDKPNEYHTELPNTVLVASISTENDEDNENDTTPQTNNSEGTDDETDSLEEGSENDERSDAEGETEDGNDGANDNEEVSDSVERSDNSEGADDENGSNGVSVPEEDENGEDNDEKEIEKVKIFNNHVSHEVTKPIHKMDDATKSLIRVVTNTVSPYQKLYSTFNHYFGSELMGMDTENLKDKIAEMGLKELVLVKESQESLYKFFNHTDIEEIITDEIAKIIKERIHEDIEIPLSDFQENIAEFRDVADDVTKEQLRNIIQEVRTTRTVAQEQNDNLAELFDEVANWREQSLNLLDQHGVVQENDTEEQEAIMTLNNGFQPLLSESQSIAEQAHGNLSSAESVYQTLDTIDGQAETIEQSGESLVGQADQLSTEMTEKMVEDQEFAENFSDVLANSRVGERQNENLYNFLSNPVQTSNQGTITSGDDFTPYFLVLTIFIVVLFTAYVISTLHQKQKEQDQFAQHKSLMGTNTPITLITAGIGVLEGIAIGVISSYLLQISEGGMVLWTILITALITGMLLVATYLLRQLKMIGMFVLLIVMSMYLFLTNAFGAGIAGLDHLKAYSPLQYVESLLLEAVQGNANYILAMIVIAGVIVIGVLANLFVLTKEEKGDLENEGSTEAS